MSISTMDPARKELLAQAIGRLSSGVYVLTLLDAGARMGMLATWVVQAAFEPPMLTISIQKKRDLLAHLRGGARFCLNVLSKKNMDIFKAFAAPAKDGVDRFEGLKLTEEGESGPVFADALSYIDCCVKAEMDAGDHLLILAEITGGALLNADDPMLHTRKNGFQY